MKSLDYEDKTLGRCASCLHMSTGCQTAGREMCSGRPRVSELPHEGIPERCAGLTWGTPRISGLKRSVNGCFVSPEDGLVIGTPSPSVRTPFSPTSFIGELFPRETVQSPGTQKSLTPSLVRAK